MQKRTGAGIVRISREVEYQSIGRPAPSTLASEFSPRLLEREIAHFAGRPWKDSSPLPSSGRAEPPERENIELTGAVMAMIWVRERGIVA